MLRVQRARRFSTVFDKIISREIKADVVYEDPECIAFRDVAPQAPTHILVIPKVKGNLSRLSLCQKTDKKLLGHLLWASSEIARQEKLDKDGFRIVINDGKQGQQSVYYLHLHILGGRQLKWPPG